MLKIKYISHVLLLLLPLGIFAQENWQEHHIIKGLGKYNHLSVADMDNDGDIDIVASTEAWVAWFENTDGQGSFSIPHYLFDGEEELIFPIDIDLDGDIDVVLQRGVLMKTNDLPHQWIFVQEFTSFDPVVDVADYNNDGYPDIVRKDNSSYNLALNDQAGGFEEEQEIIVTASNSSSLFFADVNLDGRRDMIYGDNDELLLYKNQSGSFTTEVIAFGDFLPASFNVGDFDLDNDLEIMVVNSASDEVRYYSKATDNWTANALITTTSIPYTRNVSLSDLDMDGDLDLLLDVNSGEVIWFKNENGSFSNFMEIPNLNGTTDQVFIQTADFSGDGLLDFVCFHSNPVLGSPYLNWYRRSGDHFVSKPVVINVQQGMSQFEVADLNGDGEVEIIVRSKSITTLQNNGNGTFSAGQVLSAYSANAEMIVEDWDADGDKDVLGLLSYSQLGWQQNDGQGNFTSMILPGSFTNAIDMTADIGDLDNDGDLDFILAFEIGSIGALRWYENINNQSFTVHSISNLSDGPKFARLSDYDNDNDLDILIYLSGSNQIELVKNLGMGDFSTPEILLSNLTSRWNTMILEDLTGDGNEDIIFSTSPFSGAGIVSYFPNQVGSFGPAYNIASFGASGSANFSYGAPADLDDDGDLDMLYGSFFDHGLGVKINNGSGIFEEDHAIFSGSITEDTILTLSHPMAIDMNGDGKLDPVAFYYYACGGCFIPSSRVQNLSWFDNMLGEAPPTFINTLSSITCNVNNTVSNPLDDFLEFDLLVTNGLSGNYLISANGIEIEPNQGVYGETTQFTLAEGIVGTGDIIFDIVDQQNPNFTSSFTLSNPDFCADFEPNYVAELSSFDCNDNGTNQDTSDDYITFKLNLSALGLEGEYSISADNHSILPATGVYNSEGSFELSEGSAGVGDITVSIVDNNNSEFTTSFTVFDPGTCSEIATSVKELNTLQIQLNPNPFTDVLQLSLTNYTNLRDLKFQLRSVDGKVVYAQNLREEKTYFSVPHLVRGLYVCELIDTQTKEILTRARLIKQ